MGDAIVSLLASCVMDRGCKSWSGQTRLKLVGLESDWCVRV